MSQSWTSGYVADIAYIEGFYIQQSPARMALACLSGNVAVDLPEPDDPACYLELGCGVGIGALLTAASNPGWQVTAIDYNPAHIAMGASLARAARLDNIRFVEADLSQLAGTAEAEAIPAADFVSMHGMWSWVSSEVRAGHCPVAGRQDASRRHGASQLQRPAGLAGRRRDAEAHLRGRHPLRRPQRPAGPGRTGPGARHQGGRRQISHREHLRQRPHRHHHRHVAANTCRTNI